MFCSLPSFVRVCLYCGAKSETFAQPARQIYLFIRTLLGAGVTLEDKPDFEKLHLINQLEEDDKITVYKIIDTMLTKKKFKDFFNKNVAAL